MKQIFNFYDSIIINNLHYYYIKWKQDMLNPEDFNDSVSHLTDQQ